MEPIHFIIAGVVLLIIAGIGYTMLENENSNLGIGNGIGNGIGIAESKIIDPFTHYPRKACKGRNEISNSGYGGTVSGCRAKCLAFPNCISYEVKNKGKTCHLSTSCNQSRMTSYPDYDLYIKN